MLWGRRECHIQKCVRTWAYTSNHSYCEAVTDLLLSIQEEILTEILNSIGPVETEHDLIDIAKKVDLDLASRLLEEKLVPHLSKLNIDLRTVCHLIDTRNLKSKL